MPDNVQTETAPGVANLVGGIVNDVQRLLRQEVALARSEVRQEWEKTKTAASSMGLGVGTCALAGLLLVLFVVHILNWAFTWPEWGGYLLVGGVLAVVGGALFFIGRAKASQVHVVPPRTAEELRENVQWIQHPTH